MTKPVFRWLGISICGLVGLGLLWAVKSATVPSRAEIPVRFQTDDAFRKACLQGTSGAFFCSPPVDKAFTGNPDHRTVIAWEFRRHWSVPVRERLVVALGDSVRLALVGWEDTVYGARLPVCDSCRTKGFDFGQVGNTILDPSHISRFLNDSVLLVDPHFTGTSLVSLIADPRSFHLRKLRVSGYLRAEPGAFALYLHRDDFLERRSENALQIGFSPGSLSLEEILRLYAPFQGEAVTLEGVFLACTTQTCPYPGVIAGISKILVHREGKWYFTFLDCPTFPRFPGRNARFLRGISHERFGNRHLRDPEETFAMEPPQYARGSSQGLAIQVNEFLAGGGEPSEQGDPTGAS